ncbi:MAG: tetratricopeptide repeat protein [Bacilli bacterium]|jgi:TPR repeat protein
MKYLWEIEHYTDDQLERIINSENSKDYEAITALALFYALGKYNFPKDNKRAIKLLNYCMRDKHAQSYYVYALLLINPAFSVQTDEHKYIAFLKRSANLGFDKAMSKIGEAYLFGIGVKLSLRDAESYLTKARCKESVRGLEKLAQIYEEGYPEKAESLKDLADKFSRIV